MADGKIYKDGFGLNNNGAYLVDFKIEDYPGDKTKIVIPEGVTTIFPRVFCGSELTWNQDTKSPLDDVEEFVLPEGLLEIQSYAFYRTSASKINFPSTLTTIGKSAFDNAKITSIDFSNNTSLTTIDEHAFFGAVKVQGAVKLPDSVRTIGNLSFYSCMADEIILNEGLESIGRAAFGGTKITSLSIPSTVVSGSRTNLIQDSDVKKLEIHCKVVAPYMFEDSCWLEEATIYSEAVGSLAFNDCISLKSVSMPNVKNIVFRAFEHCKQLTNVHISDKVTNIDPSPFTEVDLDNLLITSDESSDVIATFCKNQGIKYRCLKSNKKQNVLAKLRGK